MPSESVYKIIELVGTSTHSWEEAAQNAVDKANQSLRDIRIVTIQEQDAKVENGKIVQYRVRLKLSFKFEE